MLNGYLVGIKPRGAAFSLTLRRGRSYIRRGTQDVPGFARIFCTARIFRKQASGLPFRHKKTPNLKVGRILLVASVIRLGFEPKTHSLEGCCSIQLSYRTRSHSDGLARLVVLF